jgi:predicted enzyme related to lactoylglutathione lyase
MSRRQTCLITAFIVMGALVSCSGDTTPATTIADKPSSVETTPTTDGTFTGKNLFAIFVTDLKVSAEFYRDILGFEFIGYLHPVSLIYQQEWTDQERSPVYAAFKAGEQKFGLAVPQRALQEAWVATGRYFFQVNDLEAHRKRIADTGTSLSPIMNSPLLQRFYVPDPDGLQIYFAVTVADAPHNPW